jgi:hypothetical protein
MNVTILHAFKCIRNLLRGHVNIWYLCSLIGLNFHARTFLRYEMMSNNLKKKDQILCIPCYETRDA